jgi:hypothetical protein
VPAELFHADEQDRHYASFGILRTLLKIPRSVHTVYLCVLYGSQNKQRLFLIQHKLASFVTETKSVYCAVWKENSTVIPVNLSTDIDFPLPVSLHQCCTLIFDTLLLPDAKLGNLQKATLLRKNEKHGAAKYLHLLSVFKTVNTDM